MVKAYHNSGFLLIGIGVTGMILSTFADSIGLGGHGFGLMQLSGLVLGGLVSAEGDGHRQDSGEYNYPVGSAIHFAFLGLPRSGQYIAV